jgi:hypothetical protein
MFRKKLTDEDLVQAIIFLAMMVALAPLIARAFFG